MTTARRKRKQYRAGLAFGARLLACIGLFFIFGPSSRAAAERIVVDWHSGLAIAGYDPVAFFTDGKPMAGRAELELRYGGVVWRFTNVGNRAAFAARPDVYMPQFGGYDPLGIGRGVAVAGNPTVWRIAGARLFLFYDHARLASFNADPDRVIAAADRKWPEVRRTLSP